MTSFHLVLAIVAAACYIEAGRVWLKLIYHTQGHDQCLDIHVSEAARRVDLLVRIGLILVWPIPAYGSWLYVRLCTQVHE